MSDNRERPSKNVFGRTAVLSCFALSLPLVLAMFYEWPIWLYFAHSVGILVLEFWAVMVVHQRTFRVDWRPPIAHVQILFGRVRFFFSLTLLAIALILVFWGTSEFKTAGPYLFVLFVALTFVNALVIISAFELGNTSGDPT